MDEPLSTARCLKSHIVAALLLIVAGILIVQLREPLITAQDENPMAAAFHSRFEDYLSGDGAPHLVKRPLMRFLVLGCQAVIGSTPRAINELLQTLFACGALLIVYGMGLRFFTRGEAFACALLVGVFLPWGNLALGMNIVAVYDLPALFFCCVGMAAVFSRCLPLLLVTILVGTLNKETTLWLVPAWAACRWDQARTPRVATETIGLSVAFLVSAVAFPRLMLRLPATVGAMDTGHLADNVSELLLMGRGGLLQNVYLAVMPVVIAFAGWRFLRRDFRRLLLGLFALLVPILLFGAIHEVRIFAEALPLAALCCMEMMTDRIGGGCPLPEAADAAPVNR